MVKGRNGQAKKHTHIKGRRGRVETAFKGKDKQQQHQHFPACMGGFLSKFWVLFFIFVPARMHSACLDISSFITLLLSVP